MAMRLSNVENFSITKSSAGRYTVNWTKGDRRYHVWYYLSGAEGRPFLESILHSNPIAPPPGPHRRDHHRALDFLGKSHAEMRADVWKSLTDEAIKAADDALAKEEADKEEASRAARYERIVGRVNAILGGEQPIDPKSRVIFCALLTVPRDDLLRLM